MIIVSKADGTIVGAMPVAEGRQPREMQAGLAAGPGETIREVDLPDEFSRIMDGEKLHDRLKAYLSKKP